MPTSKDLPIRAPPKAPITMPATGKNTLASSSPIKPPVKFRGCRVRQPLPELCSSSEAGHEITVSSPNPGLGRSARDHFNIVHIPAVIARAAIHTEVEAQADGIAWLNSQGSQVDLRLAPTA